MGSEERCLWVVCSGDAIGNGGFWRCGRDGVDLGIFEGVVWDVGEAVLLDRGVAVAVRRGNHLVGGAGGGLEEPIVQAKGFFTVALTCLVKLYLSAAYPTCTSQGR